MQGRARLGKSPAKRISRTRSTCAAALSTGELQRGGQGVLHLEDCSGNAVAVKVMPSGPKRSRPYAWEAEARSVREACSLRLQRVSAPVCAHADALCALTLEITRQWAAGPRLCPPDGRVWAGLLPAPAASSAKPHHADGTLIAPWPASQLRRLGTPPNQHLHIVHCFGVENSEERREARLMLQLADTDLLEVLGKAPDSRYVAAAAATRQRSRSDSAPSTHHTATAQASGGAVCAGVAGTGDPRPCPLPQPEHRPP